MTSMYRNMAGGLTVTFSQNYFIRETNKVETYTYRQNDVTFN